MNEISKILIMESFERTFDCFLDSIESESPVTFFLLYVSHYRQIIVLFGDRSFVLMMKLSFHFFLIRRFITVLYTVIKPTCNI